MHKQVKIPEALACRSHRRLGRLKLERKTQQFRKASCCTTSCCTRGVAVAVSAISGTVGNLRTLLLALLPSKPAITQHKACTVHVSCPITSALKPEDRGSQIGSHVLRSRHSRDLSIANNIRWSGGEASLLQARGYTAVHGHQAVQCGLARHPRRTRSGPHPPRSGRGCRRGASHPARASTCRWPPPALSLPL